MINSWRKLTINLFRKLYNMIINKHNPKCNCGWNMKSTNTRFDEDSWKCIWKKCGWETFQSGNGKLHWKKS